jgi:hypothetical protein
MDVGSDFNAVLEVGELEVEDLIAELDASVPRPLL